ncbi:DNA gyrase/topoisomerase IV subunit A [Bacillus licheniformis]|uniref:DNA gyrase/topoisomerase IV subunit A n=1 Tax=Bacillus licheniformis TaxID=1402 RepID=UPI00092C1881|nr:DNA topoisomerase (ATP-hydrolyzing) subunit A [Bacillus licheniformis]OJT57415.1 topoisomerase IV [Bacillus licheniformis]OJT69943.1 topoisomerase IV [Bacillus licheniformis]
MNNMIEENIVETLTKNYMPYTAHVIMERALPEIDGLKPSQRRILYTMYKMGLQKGGRKKSQGVVGQTMFLHPHGDAAIYETLVRMSKDAEALLIPFIDSKGNFGKQYSRDMKYASARYTEVRLTEIAKELFKNIDKNTVEMIDNYDGTLKEPRYLPVTFPAILTNPQNGIANGMASSIAPFNLNEVIDYTIQYIKNPKHTKVSDYIKAPDFPTGGNIVYNQSELERIYDTGKGSVVIRSSYRFEKNSIIFEDIPYTTSFEAVIEKISQLVKEGKLKEVVDVDDIYGINSKGIEVTVKNNIDKKLLVEKLFKLTPLQSSFGCNFNIIVNGRPKVLGVKQIIHEWLAFRANTIKRGFRFEKQKKESKMHLLSALKQVLLDIDKAIKIIRETKTNNEVVERLMTVFSIDKEQAEFVAEIKLRHLNKEYLINRIKDIENLKCEIENLDDLLNNRKRLAQYIIDELANVKKLYGKQRKSNVIQLSDIPKIEADKIEVDDYNVKVFITKDGYLKKVPLTSLRGNYSIKVKDGDEVIKEVETTNNSEVLVFTDQHRVYKHKIYEIEDHKPSSLGEYLPSLLELKEENVLFVTVTNDYDGYLIVGFEDGKVAKIDLSAYQTKQNRKMLTKAYADKTAIFFEHIREDIDILVVSSIGKALVFNTSMINSKTSKTTIGVQVLKSKNDSIAEAYYLLKDKFEEAEYYRTANAGVGKYLRKEDFSDILLTLDKTN